MADKVFDSSRTYWLHGPGCWESDENWLDIDPDPYCVWDLERRLADDPYSKPEPDCGGRWVKLVEV